MLATAAIVEAVAAAVEALDLPNLVVDPVMVAKSGDRLLDDSAVHALRASLLPLARVVTPNVPGSGSAGGHVDPIASTTMREAARRIARLKARAVVVKGGHLPGAEVGGPDRRGRRDFVELTGPRVDGPNTHGTGCTFAAAIAARLALGRGAGRCGARRQGTMSPAPCGTAGHRLGAPAAAPLLAADDTHAVIGHHRRPERRALAHRHLADAGDDGPSTSASSCWSRSTSRCSDASSRPG